MLKKTRIKRLCIEYNKIQYYTHINVEINLGSRAFSFLTWPPLESPILSPLNTVNLRLGNSPLSHIVMSDCCTCSVPTLFHPWYLKVFKQLPVQKLSGFSYQVEDREPDLCSPWEDVAESTAKDDVYSVFKVRYE